MRTAMVGMLVAVGISLLGATNVSAAPVMGGAALKDAITTTQPIDLAQAVEKRKDVRAPRKSFRERVRERRVGVGRWWKDRRDRWRMRGKKK